MLILGISELDNDSGAVLIRDGEQIGAANEERFTRVKQQDGVPVNAINWLLGTAGATMSDVDKVVVVRQDVHNEYPHWQAALDDVKWFSWDGPLSYKALNYGVWKFRNTPRALKLHRMQNQRLTDFLREHKVPMEKVSRPDHHLMHVACAYYGSGYDKCLVFTCDGQGDGRCATLYLCEHGEFKLVHDVKLPHSPGAFYASVTKAAGYRPARHEGKITGLAAHGEYDEEVMNFARQNLYMNGETFEAPFAYGSYPFLKRLLARKGKEKLAWAYQHVLEDVLSKYVHHWVKKTGATKLAVAGGVCANVRLNQKLFELPEVENIFVFPGMSDGGLGWGAAWYAWHQHNATQGQRYEPQRIRDVYFGPNYSDEEIEKVLKRERVKYSRPQNLEKKLAALLHDGEIIARFQGAMEFGPRALCHRTIMYQPTDPTVNDWLNVNLHRTEFMPFAPVTLHEDRDKCYKNLAGAEHTAEFMTITFDCTEEMARTCPAVVHIDNTARPQLVRKEIDPSTHSLLTHYKELTGLSSIINTSFNMHEEPIVCSPEDAVRASINAKFRYLACGPFLCEFDFPSPPQAKPTRLAD